MQRLCAPLLIERDVLATLQAILDIPIGEAMADIIKDRARHIHPLRLLACHCDIRRIGVLHPDDVVAGIDMLDFAGHAACEIG